MLAINLKNLDKSNWKPFHFDEIAKNISERVDPTTTDLKVYIGLEHLDAESIHIKRTGTPDDVKGQKLKAYPGDIIFGKRRAYQRKAALVTEEVICSAHAFVLRANPEVIDPKLFPFFLHSDMFMHRAVDISVGGLSPTINWGILKSQEFLLPPKEQQAELAELLWSMDAVIEKELNVLEKLDIQFRTLAIFISDTSSSTDRKYKKIKEVATIKDNLRKPLNSSEREKMKGDIPYYGANGKVDQVNDFIFDEDLILLAEDGGNFSEFYKKPIAYKVTGKSWVNNHAHVITAKDDKCSIDWLYYSLVHKNIMKYIIGTTRVKLNKSELENVKIWIPDAETMNQLIDEIKMVEKSRKLANDSVTSSKSLQKSLINQVF